MINFLFGTTAKESLGPIVNIDCVCCGRQETKAHSRERTEWLVLFHFVPLFPFQTVFVRCDACQKDMIAECSLEELAQSNPLTLKLLLVERVSFVGKACIILGILLCWAPLVGLIPAIIGFCYRRQYEQRMRKISILGLVLSSSTTLLSIVGLFVQK